MKKKNPQDGRPRKADAEQAKTQLMSEENFEQKLKLFKDDTQRFFESLGGEDPTRWEWALDAVRGRIDFCHERLEEFSRPQPPIKNEDDFLDAPVTTRTLVAVVALAVQEIKGLDNEAGFDYFTTLHHNLWDMVKDDPRYAKREDV